VLLSPPQKISTISDRARQVMKQIEKHSKIAMGLRKGIKKEVKNDEDAAQLDIFDEE
jgi:DNA mismatch repair protein MutS